MCRVVCPECNGILQRDDICNCDHYDFWICEDCKKKLMYSARLIRKLKELDNIMKEIFRIKKEESGE